MGSKSYPEDISCDPAARSRSQNLLALLLEGEIRGEGGAQGFCPHPRSFDVLRTGLLPHSPQADQPQTDAGEGNHFGSREHFLFFLGR
jgi:hypothetical protein